MASPHLQPRPQRLPASLMVERRLLEALQTQQAHIARELHDGVGSSLAAIAITLGHLQSQFTAPLSSAAAASPHVRAQAALALTQLSAQVAQAIQATRELAGGIMPISSAPGALCQALQRLCSDVAAMPGICCQYTVMGDWAQLPQDMANHLYRIVQEGISNALRGGQASALELSLWQHGAQRELLLRDNGTGMSVASRAVSLEAIGQPVAAILRQGLGLDSMRVRSKLMGAQLRFSRPKQGGTLLAVRWKNA